MKILFYPRGTAPGSKVWFYTNFLKIPRTKDIDEDGISHIYHNDYANENKVSLEILNLGLPIINKTCTNIKKDYIDQIFEKVFGYSTMVNPRTHKGYCVQKSTQNAIHNGKIVKCPMNPDLAIHKSKSGENHSVIYQKLIDTRIGKDLLHDIRVPVFKGKVPCVFIKQLGMQNTFHPYKEHPYNVYMDAAHNHLTQSELNNIESFCLFLGLDYGELDILRNNSDGLIYIVDVNDKPHGVLFNKLGEDKDKAVELLSNYFKKYCL